MLQTPNYSIRVIEAKKNYGESFLGGLAKAIEEIEIEKFDWTAAGAVNWRQCEKKV